MLSAPPPLPTFVQGTVDPRRQRPLRYRCTRDLFCNKAYTATHNRTNHERTCHPLDSDFSTCPGCDSKVYTHLLDSHKLECAQGNNNIKRQRSVGPTPVAPESTVVVPGPAVLEPTVVPVMDDSLFTRIQPFLDWLGVVSKDAWSNDIKPQLINTPKLVKRQKTLLLTTIRSAYKAAPATFTDGFTLRKLVNVETLNALSQHWGTVGRERKSQKKLGGLSFNIIYKRFHLLKKICYYLSEQLGCHPFTFESYPTCDALCKHAMVNDKKAESDRLTEDASSDVLTIGQLETVVEQCKHYMDSLRQSAFTHGTSLTAKHQYAYTKHLMVALLIRFCGSRSEVLLDAVVSDLRIPSITQSGLYELHSSAFTSKTGVASLHIVPEELTHYVRFYLEKVLPPDHVGALFLNSKRRVMSDSWDAVRTVVSRILRVHATSQTIRRSISTYLYTHPTISAGELRQYATLMNHSAQTQQKQYAKLNRRSIHTNAVNLMRVDGQAALQSSVASASSAASSGPLAAESG